MPDGPPAGGPIRLDVIAASDVPRHAGWTGRLGLTFLPGKHDPDGGHWRDLATDVACLRHDHGVDALVLLVEDRELDELAVPDEVAALEGAGIAVIRFPILDRQAPPTSPAFRRLLAGIEARLRAGETVAVVCRGGLGRTGTVAACLLIDAGLSAQAAIDAVRRARSQKAIETAAQERFVRAWVSPRP